MTFGPSEHERGRGDMINTGRGGAGNAVRSPSRGRPVETQEEHDAAAKYASDNHPLHGGRGGAGNIRSPSRDPADRSKMNEIERKEHALQQEAIKKEQHQPHHSGRGGMGNIRTDSQDREARGREGGGISQAIRNISRSRSREPRSSSQRREPGEGDKGLLGKISDHLPGAKHT